MIEVKDLNDLISKFPMYPNVSLPKDVALKVDDAYVSLLVYRDKDKNASWMSFDEDVFFIEDSPSVAHYFRNIFYEKDRRALVFGNIDAAIHCNRCPKIFFIDMGAIVEHENLLKLIDAYPEAKIVIMSGMGKYVHCFIREMQELRPNIKLDFVLSREESVIIAKVGELK